VGGALVKYPELETLKLERVGPVGWLINNRPEQLNAMSSLMRDEFEVAWKTLDADPEVRVIVHTGEGRAFQTGVDVTELATDGQGMERYRESVEQWTLRFTAWQNDVWKPVITAVNGICAGGAFHWIADADIVIASSNATFFDPHVSVGQVVSIEAIGLMKKMPVEAVMRMAFVGRYERMTAQRAYELGMISEVVEHDKLLERAHEVADVVNSNAPLAVRGTRLAIHKTLDLPLHEAEILAETFRERVVRTEDALEGPKAFMEKRAPNWQCR
jgi:enoyl-CoA hydratase